MMKGKNLQPRILYPARLSFRYTGKSKPLQTSKRIQHLREFSIGFTTNAKGTLQRKEKATTRNKNIRKQESSHTVKVGNHPHKYDIKTSNHERKGE